MLVPTSRTDKSGKKALKMSLINNAAETTNTSPRSTSSQQEFQIKSVQNNIQNDDLSPTTISPKVSTISNVSNPKTTNHYNEFKCKLSQPYIECIAPNQKGNFITAINIDELNGWLLAGSCSGTLNAWKIPTINTMANNNTKHKKKKSVFECRNLILFEEDGIRHIYTFENNIVCMVGYRRICSFVDYDKSTICHWKLGINDIFTYSPFTSPHMFYSTQFQNMVHIFCRSFSSCLKIDLKTHKKEVKQLSQQNKIPLKTNVLTVNKHFVIWQSLKTKYNFYVKKENLYKNKKENTNGNVNNNHDNKVMKWLHKHTNKKRKYLQPTLIKIEVRSLSNFNPINDTDYFKPVSFNSWGFTMDNMSMNMAFVTRLNMVKILKVVADFNIMQYGIDYNKNNHLYAQQTHGNMGHNMHQKHKHNKKANNSLIDALTLSSGLSYDGSIETQSGDHVSQLQTVDILQNENDNMNMNTSRAQQMAISNGNDNHSNDVQVNELCCLKGHNGHIVAIQFVDGVVLSMATDRKLIVWNGSNGRRIATVSNIPGTFIPGYPYLIKKAKNSNQVFYTADDGIFMAVF